MEINAAGTTKRSPDGINCILDYTVPSGSLLPDAVDESPNEHNLHL